MDSSGVCATGDGLCRSALRPAHSARMARLLRSAMARSFLKVRAMVMALITKALMVSTSIVLDIIFNITSTLVAVLDIDMDGVADGRT